MCVLYKTTKLLSHWRVQEQHCSSQGPGWVYDHRVDERVRRWKSHFQTVLNRDAPITVGVMPASKDELHISIDPPSLGEVESAIKSLKEGKLRMQMV